MWKWQTASIFQSTLPVWGATKVCDSQIIPILISIHAPRVGSDVLSPMPSVVGSTFQSTLPVWGATAKMHNSSVHLWQKVIKLWDAMLNKASQITQFCENAPLFAIEMVRTYPETYVYSGFAAK